MTTFLFDLDGTLLNTIDLIVFSYRHTMEVHMDTVPPDKVFLRGMGTPLHRMFQLFTDQPEKIAAMIETYRHHNLEHHDAMVKAYPGALEAVQSLKAAGRQLALVTSKSRSVSERGLNRCGFQGLFDVVVAAEDVRWHKPDPEPVRKALEKLGANPGDTVFIGDSPVDLEAGKAAGVRTAAALWGPFPRGELAPYSPDFWLAHADEITHLTREGSTPETAPKAADHPG